MKKIYKTLLSALGAYGIFWLIWVPVFGEKNNSAEMYIIALIIICTNIILDRIEKIKVEK